MSKCKICSNDYKNLKLHMLSHNKKINIGGPISTESPNTGAVGIGAVGIGNDASSSMPPQKNSTPMEKLMGSIVLLVNEMKSMKEDIQTLKSPVISKDPFKQEASAEDIVAAHETKNGVDPKLVRIVNETLGDDFRVMIEGYEDRPGFLFSVIVPTRLSDVASSLRPMRKKDAKTEKDYEIGPDGQPLLEEYFPEDRRSCSVGSSHSYDRIRNHCERVRAYIVAYYQKMNKPLPEFKIKQNYDENI